MNREDKFARIAALRPARGTVANLRCRVFRKPARAATASRNFSAQESIATTMANTFLSCSGTQLRRSARPTRARFLCCFLASADLPDSVNAAIDPRQWLFLDTETTGLAGGTGTYAFMIGIAWWDAGGLQVEQFFMRDLDEEHSVLLELAERMKQRPVLVTFNGKSFDWPLLETRYRMTRSFRDVSPRLHLDLLHPARQIWRLRIGSVRLRDLERQVLGGDGRSLDWSRHDDIDSSLIPQMYFDYLRERNGRAVGWNFSP